LAHAIISLYEPRLPTRHWGSCRAAALASLTSDGVPPEHRFRNSGRTRAPTTEIEAVMAASASLVTPVRRLTPLGVVKG
jgi:hypothetical protein